MISPLFVLWTTLLRLLAPISGISIVPVEDRTEVVIHVDGAVTAKDFSLRDPNRIVIDVTGAQQGLSRDRFSGLNRGGILGVRVAQREPEVVRVVIDLAQSVKYEVAHIDGEIRVSFPNPVGAFEPWATGTGSSLLAQEPRPQQPQQPATQQPRAGARPNEIPPTNSRDVPLPLRNPTQQGVLPTTNARDVQVPAANARPGNDQGASTRTQQQRQQPRITVSFNETPILDVLTTFAEFSGRSIVAGSGVAGTVTADIRNQPWDVALEAILAAQGLSAAEQESGIIRVDKLDNLRANEKLQALVTRQFKIRYINADSLLPALNSIKSDSGKIATARGSNAVIVTDRPAVIERIEPLIRQLDVRTPQVTISAKIIFIDRTAFEQLGVVYDLKDSRGNQLNTIVQGARDENGNGIFDADEGTNDNLILLGGNSIAGLGNAQNRVSNPTLQLVSSLVLGRHSLVSFLEATQTLNLSDIQAAPVVTTLDNREANIQVGEQTPIRVIDAGTGAAQGSFQQARATVQLKNTGVILRVTPHITGNQVLMELHAERSNVGLQPGDLGLTFQTQEANTQVLVQDGETAVIGGLTIIEKSKVRAGIPLLMDLPVLGSLFRNTTDRENKRDLLIMVTPHIVRDGET